MKYTSLLTTVQTVTTAIVCCWMPLNPIAAEEASAPSRQELESSAATGDAAAILELAKDCFRGKAGPADPVKAGELFLEAARKGNPEAMDWVGVVFTNGSGLPRDEKQAEDWFRKSANLGHARGMLHLGLLLRQAKDIPVSNEESLRWLTKASEAGEPEATAILGRILFTGDRLQPADFAKAIPYLQSAADAGDPVCQNMLGLCYRDGGPVEVDREKAKVLFRKAAMQNDRKAQANLAVELGVGTPNVPERTEALAWLIISKNQDEFTAQKTFDEVRFSLPPGMLAEAEKIAADLEKKLPPPKPVNRLPSPK